MFSVHSLEPGSRLRLRQWALPLSAAFTLRSGADTGQGQPLIVRVNLAFTLSVLRADTNVTWLVWRVARPRCDRLGL